MMKAERRWRLLGKPEREFRSKGLAFAHAGSAVARGEAPLDVVEERRLGARWEEKARWRFHAADNVEAVVSGEC